MMEWQDSRRIGKERKKKKGDVWWVGANNQQVGKGWKGLFCITKLRNLKTFNLYRIQKRLLCWTNLSLHVPIVKNLSLASFMLPWIRQQKELSVQLKKYWKLSTEKCPFYTVLWFPSETVKGTLLKIFPFSVGRNRIPCSACILKLNILSFQERGVSLALILWGHMSERHIVLVAQQAPCYSHCWTIR